MRTEPRPAVGLLVALGLAALVTLLSVTGCTGEAATPATTTTVPPPETTTTTEAPLSAGKEFSFYVPAVGDCFDVRPVDKAPPIYLKLDCSLPHQSEVFATFDYDGKDWPGPQVLEDQAKATCPASWLDYVGKPYEISSYELAYQLPDQAGWGNGVRHVVGCLVVPGSGDRLTGSVKGTAK